MPKTYNTAIGFLKHLSFLATKQEMAGCRDWNKLTDDQQQMFYEILASIQNGLGDMQREFDKEDSIIHPEIYHG